MKCIKAPRKPTVLSWKTLCIKLFLALLCSAIYISISAQTTADLLTQWNLAKLQKGYQTQQNTVDLLNRISSKYVSDNPDSALYYGNVALQINNTL